MVKQFSRDSETFQAIAKYLKNSLGYEVRKVVYAGTHSNNGLTPIVHYDIEYMKPASKSGAQEFRIVRITVHWNNDVPSDQTPTITQMYL